MTGFLKTQIKGAWFGCLMHACILGIAGLAYTGTCAAQTYSKTETTVYSDDLSHWVLGQVSTVTCTVSVPADAACDGGSDSVESQTTYDTLARPTTIKSFGKLKQTLTYNADGTVKTVKDGNNNVTTITGWKRGIPLKITYAATPDQPTAVSQLADVHDDGTIASVTDENGYKTSYTYDAMGRLASITYPTGDTATWAATTQAFAPATAASYGLPAGHWEQKVATGKGTKIVYFDALWRPVVEEAFDNTSSTAATATRSLTVKRYDEAGRLSFQSYPVASLTSYTSSALKGTATTYDALDRPLTVKQDSELGVLTTTTDYQDGFQVKVTNPRAKSTTTSFMAWDQPTYDYPVAIVAPAGTYTDIPRDAFGKPTALVRRNSTGSVSSTRHYVYNAAQELCKTIEPETGSTVMHYDAAGNLDWSAAGLNLTSTTSCQDTDAGIAARKATRGYDARNRLMALTFPDHKGDLDYAYTPDGLQASVSADNGGTYVVTTQYTYNKRRLLTYEELLWKSTDYTAGYAYDANGHLSSYQPGSITLDYAPNALGQPTKVSTYATGVNYYPNGAIKQFTYGNGIVHTLTQNMRGLPDTSCDAIGSCNASAILNDGYDYDQNGNVAAISDGVSGHRGDRDMAYDDLDRLTQTVSPMFGTATYTYDVLDNLTRVEVGATANAAARDQAYCYDAQWRLTNVKTGSCSGTSVVGIGYDAQGNVTNKNGIEYAFDYGNRLRSAGTTPVSTYLYDGQGRRVNDTSGTSKHTMYNQAGQLVYTNDDRNLKTTYYIYLGNSLVALNEKPDGGVYAPKYQHTDALGTPVAVTDAAGNVIERSEYEPYGRLGNRSVHDGPGFTGHVADAATGLDYMQQRYYDPGIGRFLSVDPVTANSGTGANFNRYWYANNNPYKFTDPDGRNVMCNGTSCAGTCHSFIECGVDGMHVQMAVLSRLVENLVLPMIQQQSQESAPESESPPLPGGLVGTDDGKGGQQGDRINNGPLAPENGGTGDAGSDFDHLTGGNSSPAPEGSRLPEGSRMGENGVIYRPPNGSSGPRIDIPTNGDKPHETLHYPPPPPPPPPDERLQ